MAYVLWRLRHNTVSFYFATFGFFFATQSQVFETKSDFFKLVGREGVS